MAAIKSYRPVSEDAILAFIDEYFPNSHPGLLLGRGDDCAVFKAGAQMCASTDLFNEDAHFRRGYFEPGEIGYKALAVNISDIAAMGAKPIAFSLGLGLPAWVSSAWLRLFFEGMADLARQEGVALAGGDISRSHKLQISITVFGECPPGHSLLLRGGNMPGDVIFLVGEPGLARTGLKQLELYGRKAMEAWPAACAAHLRPALHTEAGLMLSRAAFNSRPPTLMDVSDGIARDLPRLLGQTSAGPQLGAEIEIPVDMLHQEVLRSAEINGKDPAIEAFIGGEDYALLGACAPDMASIMHSAIPGLRNIGHITDSGRIYCNGRDVTQIKGFDHFSHD